MGKINVSSNFSLYVRILTTIRTLMKCILDSKLLNMLIKISISFYRQFIYRFVMCVCVCTWSLNIFSIKIKNTITITIRAHNISIYVKGDSFWFFSVSDQLQTTFNFLILFCTSIRFFPFVKTGKDQTIWGLSLTLK